MSWWSRRREQIDAFRILAEDITKRQQIQAEADAKRAEFELRKLEIEAQYAEHLAKAKIAEKDAASERRQKARQYGREGHARRKENEANKPPNCKLCANPNDLSLTPLDIEWHHAGHPANFQPTWQM
jgi:hypothetical protein